MRETEGHGILEVISRMILDVKLLGYNTPSEIVLASYLDGEKLLSELEKLDVSMAVPELSEYDLCLRGHIFYRGVRISWPGK